MNHVKKIAFDTLKAGAPGLSDQTREALSGIIARKVALSTTPARAEAQDEGAAGELVIRTMLRDAFIAGRVASTSTTGREDQRDAEAYASERNLPSPPPAADADRVRGEQIQWRQTPPPQDGTIIYGHS